MVTNNNGYILVSTSSWLLGPRKVIVGNSDVILQKSTLLWFFHQNSQYSEIGVASKAQSTMTLDFRVHGTQDWTIIVPTLHLPAQTWSSHIEQTSYYQSVRKEKLKSGNVLLEFLPCPLRGWWLVRSRLHQYTLYFLLLGLKISCTLLKPNCLHYYHLRLNDIKLNQSLWICS